jgi:hypothetical protein
MSKFGCDECGWHGDDPLYAYAQKEVAWFCPVCFTIIAKTADEDEARGFIQKKLRKLDGEMRGEE